MQSRERGNFEPLINFGRLKKRSGMGTYIRMALMTQNPGNFFYNQDDFDKRLFLRANHTGFWLNIYSTMVTGIALAATEFSDFMCIS